MEEKQVIESKVAVTETAPDDDDQQEKQFQQMQAQREARKLAKRDKGFVPLLEAIVRVMTMQKKLGLTFIPLVRKDYIIRESVRWLKKASAQDLEAKIGKHLQPLLDAKETSLKVIEAHLKEKSRTEETGPDGKTQKLTPWYKWDGDGYIVIERKED